MDETSEASSRPPRGRRRGTPREQEPVAAAPTGGRRRAATPDPDADWLQDGDSSGWLQEEADVPDLPFEEIQGVERIIPVASEDHSPESTAGEDADESAGEAPPVDEDDGKRPLPRRALDPFRPELQGLRAIAILMVVTYHIWFGRVSGGVDIFLLISAFLLTGSFARRLDSGSRLHVPSYWIHAFKRLLPPATFVILATLGASALLLPATRWKDLIGEALASGLYYENWLLIAQSVDYYAADHSTASPFQHFWSLSIQGQVFLLWPLLFALVALLAKILPLSPRRIAVVLFAAVTVASFAWSVHLTATDQTLAYFDTRTRLWEFGLGSLIALVLPTIERRIGFRGSDGRHRLAPLRAAAGWVGLALILSAGWVLDVEGAFPGYVALWPLLAAGLIIVCGPTGTRWGADRLLSSRPLQWLGDVSYSLYLVHWPLLILVLVATDRQSVGPWLGIALVAGSVLAAWILTVGLDTPIRTSRRLRERWWRGALVVLTCLALVIGPTTAWARVLEQQQEAFAEQAAPADNPGAQTLVEDPGTAPPADDAPVLPALGARSSDWASDDMTGWCDDEPGMDIGSLGHLDCARLVSPEEPTKRVVAVGNSHTDQWMAALTPIAEEEGWELVIIRRPACFFTSAEDNSSAQCDAWLDQAEGFLDRWEPDAILVQSTFTTRDGQDEVIRDGMEDQVERWTATGAEVIGLRDNPRFATSHEECELDRDAESCDLEHVAATTPDPTLSWEEEHPGYAAVDMNDVICPGGTCPSIIGNVYVYLDDDHITATFARSAAPQLKVRLEEAMSRAEAARDTT